MSDAPAAKILKSTMLAGAAAAVAFAGLAAAPTLFSQNAGAQQIAIAPPAGAPMSFADLVERVSPAVVSINVTSERPSRGAGEIPPELEELLRRFPQLRPPQDQPRESLGSGFFIDERGTVVTNHHVIDGATEITIRTNSGAVYKAEVIGSDQLSDVAVLRLTDGGGQRFPHVEFDEDARLRVGDWVVAVGNPFGLEGSATAGIVSAIGRRDIGPSALVDFIQIDAPINRGNSGGPTFDLYGRVVGVNSAIFSPTGGNVGIGFAIPASTAERVVRDLLDSGRVSRGWLGVQVQPMDEDLARSLGLEKPTGALVASVVAGGPAEAAGLRQGDLILRVNGAEVENQPDLTRKVAAAPANQPARFEILRDGRRQTVTVRLGERPSEQQLASADQNEPATPGRPGEVRQAALGLEVRPLQDADRRRYRLEAQERGLLITNVSPSSELARKAVRRGDVIVEAGGRPVATVADLEAAIEAAARSNLPVRLQIVNEQGRRFVAANVGEAGRG